jgi:hypothetical protein
VLTKSGSGSYSGIIAGINHVVELCLGGTYEDSGKRCIGSMSLGGGKSDAVNDGAVQEACVRACGCSCVGVCVRARNVLDIRSHAPPPHVPPRAPPTATVQIAIGEND